MPSSWIRELRDEDIARIFDAYIKKYAPDKQNLSINDAYCQRFNLREMPDELNESHELVIVASNLDSSTERIVNYLADEYEVSINAIFFRVFRDGKQEFLTRAWLNDPTETKEIDAPGKWNGEFYVSFGVGEHRNWEDAQKYGFISAGGGTWYTNTLHLLEPGARIWVNVPGTGYVGVGRVTKPAVHFREFLATSPDGTAVPVSKVKVIAKNMTEEKQAEHLVGVDWIETVPLEKAVREKGFFGNQNSVARPKTPKWAHTIERLKKRFGVD